MKNDKDFNPEMSVTVSDYKKLQFDRAVLLTITAAWNHYYNNTDQSESAQDEFFDAVRDSLEKPF